ncbi:MAG: InlB B-repeat-containing protein, partial [Peptococcus niger]
MNNNWKQKLKKSMKRALAGFVGAAVLATSFPLPDPALAQVNYEDLTKDKATIINKAPVTPVKLENGQAADLIQNPAQPAIYTLRTDYMVPKGQEWKINYQPYVASVGEKASDAEKAKVNKVIELPELKGYDKPEEKYQVTYADIVEKAKVGKKTGVEYLANQEFLYSTQEKAIQVKHVFQDLYDFNKYGKRKSDTDIVYTKQTGKTGSMLEVQPLQEPEIPGFVPEASQLSTLVPENTENFVVEYRYNRKTFEVDFDTNGGTPIASRQLYYEQTIPTVQEPTKVGSDFVGWKPSVELNDSNGNRFAANALMTDSTGNAIKDLKTDIVMPAMNVTFTAVWQDKPKAEYVIQFWTEKTDYDKDNTLPLRDRYDFIGARRIDDADTGSTPELTNLDIHGITFPDLNDGRLEKAQDSKEEFERYYFLNEGLTKKQNASKENPNVQKSVLSTGETVYNVYYDRRVYTLYFTAANELAFENAGSFWPIITREGQVIGKEGSPYKVDVRFNQSLNKIWPKDAEVSNLPPGSSDPKGDTGLIGWIINNNAGETVFRDTPPYRLSAEDFIDNQDVVGEGELEGFGHSDEIPIKDGENKKRDKYEISLGSTSLDTAVVHHIDIIKDDFDGKEQIDYDMSYWKSDTNAVEYPFILPNLQGFALKEERREAEWVLEEPTDNQYRTINDLNRDRNKITPFRSDADKIKYIPKFPWGTKLFKGKNAYNYANYTRNKYKLKLNNDPKTVKNDSEYGEGNIIDVPYELPLKDLKLDTDHVPERPDWVHEDWSFLGWALDPAGENLVKDGKETKLHYDQVLYAKWGEPKTFWTVTVDPAEGKMKTLNPTDIVKKKATVDEKEYPVKEPNQGANQIFTVSHKQQLKDLPKPTRQGYDFLGWEWVRHNEDGSVDNSYRKTYHVPELYPFGNDVVGDVYLKAIWVENNRVNLMAYHHFIDDDGMELKDALKKVPIVNVRAGQYTSASGFYQNEDWILASPEELEKLPDEDVKNQYEEYNDRVKFDNTDFHTIRVEPAKIQDENGNMVENPNAKNNVFHFYYRHFRTRKYKVNYLDERGREEMKDATTPEAKKKVVETYSIIPQENVVSKNRHFDARNYRPIPGWKLVSDPQQQLFYDVDETTGEFEGINGTGSDEITFYYKDVRVIEVPKDGETPKGYVRVTFKADKGGSFGKDANDKEITELNYDVIKGLKSDLLPVPGDPVADDKKEAGKYYVTPETGKKFVKWDEKPLLNKNTLVENETQDFYVFTAKFEWSGLTASGLVRTEAFKDPSDKWTNNFAPTIDDLKKQLVWKEKDQVKDLPAGTVIKLYDEADNELTIDDQVYDLVNEKKAPDKDEVVRTVNIKAKVTFTDGKDPQELDIPITVYKNVYEALNKAGDKPLFLKEAEGKEAKDGGLKDVTGEYVKVTVKASKDFNAKDDKIYYVNKNAWVEIPEVKT